MKTNNQMDERQILITTKALAWAFVFLFVCTIAAMFYNIITTGDAGWEFWAMLGACLVIIIARRILGDVEQPKDLMGKPLPTGSSNKEKAVRKKDYALQSLIFASVCSVMDILLVGFGFDDVTDLEVTQMLFPQLSKGVAVAVTAVMTFVIMFLISYLFEYLIGELYKVRKYNQMISELDSDEE